MVKFYSRLKMTVVLALVTLAYSCAAQPVMAQEALAPSLEMQCAAGGLYVQGFLSRARSVATDMDIQEFVQDLAVFAQRGPNSKAIAQIVLDLLDVDVTPVEAGAAYINLCRKSII